MFVTKGARDRATVYSISRNGPLPRENREMEEGELTEDEEEVAPAATEEDKLAAKQGLELWLRAGELVLPARPDVPLEMIELEKIPRRLWAQTLGPFPRSQRTVPVRQVSDPALQELAWEVADEMDRAESRRAIQRDEQLGRALRRGAPLPLPGSDHATVRSTVQINTRLRADDHARLCQAAGAVGLRPTALARALVLNGVTKILSEHPELASAP